MAVYNLDTVPLYNVGGQKLTIKTLAYKIMNKPSMSILRDQTLYKEQVGYDKRFNKFLPGW